jgi:hypothetical protein
MPSTTFAAPYDRTTKILTAVISVALLAAVVAIQNVIVAAISALVIVLAYAYSPRGYTVVDRSVVVQRLVGNARVPLEDVREARPASKDDFIGCIRLWGSGGLFGYYGVFRTNKLGRSTWYATDRSRAVVVITGSKTVLFSPDEVDGFLSAIRGEAPVLEAVGIPVRTKTTGWLIPVIVGIAVVVPLVLTGRVLAPGRLGYNPGPPTYLLTGGSLAIRDRFFPVTIGAASTDAAGIRVVDLDQETGWRPEMRVGGFANAQYQSGWYRAANGTRMRLYRERNAQRLILLPPKGGDAPVLLQVAAPDQFADELRKEWQKP